MFQTVVDESEVFSNAQLYDNNSYYAVDGCVFLILSAKRTAFLYRTIYGVI